MRIENRPENRISRRTPIASTTRWMVGVSWLVAYVVTADVFASWLGIAELTRREAAELNVILTIAGHVFITGPFFCATSLLYRPEKDPYREETAKYFEDLETPFVSDDQQDDYDRQQRNKLGTMVIIMGTGLLLMTLIPNPSWGRLLFAACSLAILTIGASLKMSARSGA